MLKITKAAILLAAIAVASCASGARQSSKPVLPPPPPPVVQLNFQFDQQATVRMVKNVDPALQSAFLNWVNQGVYTQTPIYRQLPGVFILTGKPRLAGQPFQYGTISTPIPGNKAPQSAKTGQVGLIVHADGTVGPELILHYGMSVVSCCDAPKNIVIGEILKGRRNLKTVQRGDNLQSIAIQP